MIINAENLIIGRMATYVAKKALLGEKIDIVNSEKAVIAGKKETTLKKYKERRAKGDILHGPYFPRRARMIVKRTIRGMLPYKQPKGRTALKRIKCYEGMPEGFKNQKITELEQFRVKHGRVKFITIKEISKHLGAK